MPSELEKELAVLKTNYLNALPSKIKDIRDIWLSVSESKELKVVEELHRKVHSLAGSGATFDQAGLSKAAKLLENFVKAHNASDDLFSEDNRSEVDSLIDQLANSYGDQVDVGDEPDEKMEASWDISDGKFDVDQKSDELLLEKMKILVADDDDDNRNRLVHILKSEGHEVYAAINGEEAVSLSLSHRPDIILMDVVMPVMTGYEATRIIKKNLTDKFIPIIFLTAITDTQQLVDCISAGGDDFINKPVHPLLLNAKLAAFQRISQMYSKLDEYQKKNEEEMEASKEVLNSVTYQNDQDIKGLQTWNKSPGHFSGDTRMFKQLGDGRIYILLCDFTGHGLPAAIGTVFVSDLFRSMTSKNIAADEILDEINLKMNQILPTGRYCAAIMAEYSPNENRLLLWNCGLPDAYITDENHQISSVYSSESVPLGVIPGRINAVPYEIDVSNLNEIVLFSDGITEAEDPHGEMYGEQKLKQLIQNTGKEKNLFNVIKTELEVFMDGKEPTDDISLIVFKFK